MESGGIIESLENMSILVTDATGFLGKVFVERILRIQPNVRKLYLLIRATDYESACERFKNEIIGKELFKILKEKLSDNFNSLIMEKITLVPGDITFENLGVTNTNLLEEIYREVHVVVNVAATTNFDERYDVSLRINTLGAKHVLNLSKKCANLKLLIHLSTAYVAGEAEGLIMESPCDMGNEIPMAEILDMENKVVEKRLSEIQNKGATEEERKMSMKDLGAERAKKYGWPNTYVFTKAMGEMYLCQMKENTALVTIRPTIITSTYKDPFPGWIEGFRTLDSIAIGYGKGKFTHFLGDLKVILHVMPADMVANSMLVAITAHAHCPFDNDKFIYHIGSSVVNPVTLETIVDCIQSYFLRNPLVGKDGKPIKVGKATMLKSIAAFKKYMTIHSIYPLMGLEIVNAALCHLFEDRIENLNKKLNLVRRLAELYRPYLFFKGVFDNTNAKKLQLAARESGTEANMFNFDPRNIDWNDYFVNTHYPGIVKYVLNH